MERMTTGEVARLLGVRHSEALSLLKGAGVPFARLGREGPYLWSTPAVERLRVALHPDLSSRKNEKGTE